MRAVVFFVCVVRVFNCGRDGCRCSVHVFFSFLKRVAWKASADLGFCLRQSFFDVVVCCFYISFLLLFLMRVLFCPLEFCRAGLRVNPMSLVWLASFGGRGRGDELGRSMVCAVWFYLRYPFS